LYYVRYVKKIVTVEHDKPWCEQIRIRCQGILKLLYQQLEYGRDYSFTATKEKEPFDIIIVDGRDRVNCFINSIPKLNEREVIYEMTQNGQNILMLLRSK